MKSLTRIPAGLLAGVALVASCAPAPETPVRAAAPSAPSEVATVTVAPAPPPPPPTGIATPIAGDPDGAALAEARLVAHDCEDAERARQELVRRRIEQMRAEVVAEWRDWLARPCWDPPLLPGSHRARAPQVRMGSTVSGTGQGYGSGDGRLGLSGIGEGGSGRGAGIGLGSIGTLGHGAGAGARRATSASGTNNQVAGVDEADIVKHDGTYVYLAANGALRIFEALDPRALSVTKLPGEVRQMLVDGDRAAVFLAEGGRGGRGAARCTYGYDCTFSGDGSHTRVLVLDVADREHPRVARELALTGSLVAARRIGGAVHLVVADRDTPEPSYARVPDDLPSCSTDQAGVLAKFQALVRDNEQQLRDADPGYPVLTEHGAARPLCDALATPLSDGVAFTTVVSFDLRDERAPATTATVRSRPGAVFASEDALYLAVRHERGRSAAPWYRAFSDAREVSDIHKFQLGRTPAATRYLGSGVVPGHVLNQFAMDEWYGYLRVATTTGRVPSPEVESTLSVLAPSREGNLVRVGVVPHIAPGEDIRAVRFDGDRGYVVTFKKTDPLFVLDLADPAAPRIEGELKIPGFSTYLHRLDATHLLSIGFDAQDRGSFAYFDGLLLQLFDVSNPTEPRLLHKAILGTRGSSSEAATDHLAFNFFEARGLLAIPVTECAGGGDGRFGDRLTFSGLAVYDVSVERGFRRLGGVDHGERGASCRAWWSKASSVVKRSIVMDDLVFSIASDRMKVQRLGHLGEDVADLPLTL
ncbi:MAG: beta-propeller domain-containing protein [Myxococcales bacterium]|nr:beta-propeller domain-containing protein [Myxococcales bacterium]